MIHAALTALAQRELGPGHLVRITDDYPSEVVELLGYQMICASSPHLQVICVVGSATLTYADMATAELSVCGQRRAALQSLIADRLVEAA